MPIKILQRWKNISISKKLYFVVGIMASLIIIELLTLRFSMGKLSAVRAFVGGEGIWSKGEKQAVYQLQRYAFTRDEKDYLAFQEALKVNDGDHEARMELIKANPDMQIIRHGFIQGQIHPDDIDPMVYLLRKFYKISYISEAVAAWTAGDALLVDLRKAGADYHTLISSGKNEDKAFREISDRIKDLNDQLSTVTARFSLVLGEGSRWLENLVFMILFSLVLTVESIGFILTFLTSRSISGGLSDLIVVANKIGEGEFDQKLPVKSGDEIGQLTVAVNNMGDLLQKSYSDLEDKIKIALKTRDEFLSVASHELRTPITAILLHLQVIERTLLRSEGPVDQELLVDLAQRGTKMAKRLAYLQNVLMDLTRISLGKIELHKENVDLVILAQECIAQLNADAAKLGPVINLHAPQNLMALVDATRIGQIIINLVNNAIKYGKGSVIDVTLQSKNSSAVIMVTDHGPGIPDEKQAMIFERFERASEDEGISGLGLGLFISKQIVEAHNGKLSLESRLDIGSTFTVVIPIT